MDKNIKVEDKYSELTEVFKEKTGWHKARVKFYVSFICSMCKLQTVSFVKLSQGFEGKALQESNMRRIQRFFAVFVVDNHLIANIVFSLLPEKPSYKLSLDRTNWKFGKTDINILMLSICYKGVALPSSSTTTKPSSASAWWSPREALKLHDPTLPPCGPG